MKVREEIKTLLTQRPIAAAYTGQDKYKTPV